MADLLGLYSTAADCEASDRERLIGLLFEFVERVVKKGATPEEVKVLPEIAQLLAELLPENAKPEFPATDRLKQLVAESMAVNGLARATVRRHRTDKQ